MKSKQNGQIIIMAMAFVLIITFLVAGTVTYTLIQARSHKQAVAREQALNIAEAGVEDAIWSLNNVAGYTGETNTAYSNGTYTVAVSNLSSATKVIKVDAYIPNSTSPTAHRQVQITSTRGLKNFGFNYGVQAGIGGVVMDNNSQITGNIYSNGNVVGCNNGCKITGDAVIAGASGNINKMTVLGNATVHSLTNSSVSKNFKGNSVTSSTISGTASVNTLTGPSCTVTGAATYNSKTNCSVGAGSTTPNNNVPADPATVALPIDNTQIQNWENDAVSGGTLTTTTVTGTQNLGPVKINGDLIINGTMNMRGTVWVTGTLTLNNGSIVNLDPNFGALSSEFVVGNIGDTTNGYININNGSQINGSGTSGSYIMMLSLRDTTGNSNVAITAGNNVAAAILYANSGLVEVINNAGLKEITAWKLHLNNQTSVTYDSGYASAEFSTGSNGWQVADQTYQLLQ
jgi:hypothetical protein